MQKHYTAINGLVIGVDAHLDPLESEAQGAPIYLLPAGATFDRMEAEALATKQLEEIEEAKPLPAPAPSAAQLQAQSRSSMKAAIQSFVNAPAIAMGFTSGDSLMLYAGFANDFQGLAKKFGQWEAKTWVYAEAVEADVKAGKRAVPKADELLAELAKFEG